MRRRHFIAVLGTGLATWPAVTRAQSAAPRRIWVLLVGLSLESKEVKQFRLGLRDVIE